MTADTSANASTKRALLERTSTRISLTLLLLAAALWAFCPAPPAPTPPRSSGEPMKAIVYREYGAADVLRLEQVDKPLPNDNQVLIKVRAASVNPLDWHYMHGKPYLMRIDGSAFLKPKNTRLGSDVAGVVEAVGTNVTQFKPGDEVFGAGPGAFAEYVLAGQNRIALKPGNMSFEQAAAVPIAALTALQSLRDNGRLRPGQKVLINGASGGVGTFAVQIAKSLGAEVTGVCSTRNVDMVRALGADHVIDYTREDFTQSTERYDVIIDNVSNHALSDITRSMKPDGRYVLIGAAGGPNDGKWLGPMIGAIKALILSPFLSQDVGMMLANITTSDLLVLKELMDSGKVTPLIDRTYTLSEVPAAIAYVEAGRARGKVIIRLEDEKAKNE